MYNCRKYLCTYWVVFVYFQIVNKHLPLQGYHSKHGAGVGGPGRVPHLGSNIKPIQRGIQSQWNATKNSSFGQILDLSKTKNIQKSLAKGCLIEVLCLKQCICKFKVLKYVQVMFSLCSGYVQFMFRLCSGNVQVMFR